MRPINEIKEMVINLLEDKITNEKENWLNNPVLYKRLRGINLPDNPEQVAFRRVLRDVLTWEIDDELLEDYRIQLNTNNAKQRPLFCTYKPRSTSDRSIMLEQVGGTGCPYKEKKWL